MRRITFAIVVTAAVLTLLFSYRTSTSGALASSSAVGRAHVLTTVAGGAVTSAASPPPSTPDPVEVTTPTGPTTQATISRSAGPRTSAATTTKSAGRTASGKVTTASPSPTAAKPLVVDGDSEMTRYGGVQVEVTITAGKITDIQAIQYPNQEPRDQEINAQAIPQLHDQVISAQTARIDGVSGATYTTQGYTASLQSALDAANFK